MSEQKTHTFYVKGMHCPACVILTETELMEQGDISSAKSDLGTNTVTVSGDFGGKEKESIAQELTGVLAKHGYSVSVEKPETIVDWKQFKIALPIALIFIAVFILLQKLGIVNLITSSELDYGAAFFIGIIASFSSCMAVVGGLVLSMSASYARTGEKFKPQILFHLGRIVSFFILGGVIGVIGSSFSLGISGTFILSVLIGLVMIALGLNLLEIFPWAKWLVPSMPKFLSRRTLNVSKINHSLTPVLLGLLTFFLPCGFTQSMQIYALSTGSFWSGALTMLAFALGTLPILALVSFSSLSIGKASKAGIFFKTAGIIVMLFGLLNILNALAAIGFLPPLVNF